MSLNDTNCKKITNYQSRIPVWEGRMDQTKKALSAFPRLLHSATKDCFICKKPVRVGLLRSVEPSETNSAPIYQCKNCIKLLTSHAFRKFFVDANVELDEKLEHENKNLIEAKESVNNLEKQISNLLIQLDKCSQ